MSVYTALPFATKLCCYAGAESQGLVISFFLSSSFFINVRAFCMHGKHRSHTQVISCPHNVVEQGNFHVKVNQTEGVKRGERNIGDEYCNTYETTLRVSLSCSCFYHHACHYKPPSIRSPNHESYLFSSSTASSSHHPALLKVWCYRRSKKKTNLFFLFSPPLFILLCSCIPSNCSIPIPSHSLIHNPFPSEPPSKYA